MLAREDVSNRCGDVSGRERGDGDLVEVRLEEVMVASVDQCDSHGCFAERFGRVEAAEAAADDDDVGGLIWEVPGIWMNVFDPRPICVYAWVG